MSMSLVSRRPLGVIAVAVVLLGASLAVTGSAAADRSVHGERDVGTAARVQSQPALRSLGQRNFTAMARRAAGDARSPASGDPAREIGPRVSDDSGAGRSPVAAVAPDPSPIPVVGRPGQSLHFEGLSAADSRYANDGNQFSSEPPDQALCVGNGRVMEGVNTAIAVYDRTGAQQAQVLAINEFFGLAPEFDRTKNTFGPSTFDPVCLWDQQVRRWFFLTTELDVDPFSGDLTGGSHLFFAVSATDDPLGDYSFYSITTTSGDRTDRGCPCLDDFPHIGADANGFYITTNRFPIFQNGFNGAQIYAISKQGLAANASDPSAPSPTVVSINAGSVDGDEPSFTVQPAAVPPNGRYSGDREYFLSSTDATTLRESKIGIWALSNTDSLDQDNPSVRLTSRTIPSLTYVAEPKATQKIGPPHPLANLAGEPLNALDSGSDMSEVEFAAGRLWGAIGTGVGRDGAKRDGVLWLQVDPSFTNGRVDGTVVRQGYVTVATNNVMYPAIGVNAQGDGAMVMSLAGPTVFPSPSYIPINRNGVRGPVRVPDFGNGPDDGFTCYAAFVGSRARGCRWGDYSAATADGHGKIWMATEWISGSARIPFANWSTEIIRYSP